MSPTVKVKSKLSLLTGKKLKNVQTKNIFEAGNCSFKVNNRNTRAKCELCSKLTIKAPE